MPENKSRFSNNINRKNKKASFEYQFIETFVAGIVLQGTEIKSIREGKANLQESYCAFKNSELWVLNLHISPYEQGTHYNHEPKRERKLLLGRRELKKLESKSNEKGLTIIPFRLFVTGRGLAKVEIALAKGKKVHDKREDIKQKDLKREMDRMKY
jgi:SsrA-binding protein